MGWENVNSALVTSEWWFGGQKKNYATDFILSVTEAAVWPVGGCQASMGGAVGAIYFDASNSETQEQDPGSTVVTETSALWPSGLSPGRRALMLLC